MKASAIRELLITEYGMCFLDGQICPKNPYTYHHIIPLRELGKTTFENGALLRTLEHQMYHVIEQDDKFMASVVTDYFRYFKESKDLKALYEMKQLVETRVAHLGYDVEDRGKILVLYRRFK